MVDPSHIAAQLIQCDTTGTSTELVSCDLCDLVGTINVVFQYLIGFLAGLSIIMIIVGGFRYLVAAGSQNQIEAAKKTIQFAIIGIVIVILSFVIVGSILTILGYKTELFGQIACETPVSSSGGSTTPPPGPPPQKPGQPPTGPGVSDHPYAEQINNAAYANNVDPCALKVVVERECPTTWPTFPNCIGHDGHNGNNDPYTNEVPKHGLDWSRSHGIGLTQTTIFPYNKNAKKPNWIDSNTPSRLINGTDWYTVDDLLDVNTNLQAGADILEYCLNICNGDYQCAFGCYNSGKKNSGSEYATSVYENYKACKDVNQGEQP